MFLNMNIKKKKLKKWKLCCKPKWTGIDQIGRNGLYNSNRKYFGRQVAAEVKGN